MTIEERLEKVEIELKRARRYSRILLAVVLLASAGMTVAVAMTSGKNVIHENVIKANGFILVDEKANERAKLGIGFGGPELMFLDPNGEEGSFFAFNEFFSGLYLRDKNGKTRASMRVSDEGPRFELLDENFNCRAVLGAFENIPSIRLIGENGKSRATLSIAGNVPLLGLVDDNGKLRANLSVFEDGVRLNLYDEKGKDSCKFWCGWG